LRLFVENCATCFEYFRAMCTTKSDLRYLDYCGNVLDAGGKTGGQQGDPLERLRCGVRRLRLHQSQTKLLSAALEVLTDVKQPREETYGRRRRGRRRMAAPLWARAAVKQQISFTECFAFSVL